MREPDDLTLRLIKIDLIISNGMLSVGIFSSGDVQCSHHTYPSKH